MQVSTARTWWVYQDRMYPALALHLLVYSPDMMSHVHASMAFMHAHKRMHKHTHMHMHTHMHIQHTPTHKHGFHAHTLTSARTRTSAHTRTITQAHTCTGVATHAHLAGCCQELAGSWKRTSHSRQWPMLLPVISHVPPPPGMTTCRTRHEHNTGVHVLGGHHACNQAAAHVWSLHQGRPPCHMRPRRGCVREVCAGCCACNSTAVRVCTLPFACTHCHTCANCRRVHGQLHTHAHLQTWLRTRTSCSARAGEHAPGCQGIRRAHRLGALSDPWMEGMAGATRPAQCIHASGAAIGHGCVGGHHSAACTCQCTCTCRHAQLPTRHAIAHVKILRTWACV